MKEKTTYSQNIKDAYNRMIDAYESIDLDKITVLTGSNGSGKSLIRKQLPFLMKTKLGVKEIKDTKGSITSTSGE